jgi:hypothetical protein
MSIPKIDAGLSALQCQHKDIIMIQLNTGDHTSPRVGWTAIPSNLRHQARWARSRAFVIANEMPSANTYFRTMPLGRSLSDLLNDNSIWVNYDAVMIEYGRTNNVHGEIAIGVPAFRMGRWTVLATLIHELAHIDGAPGGSDKRAEEALLHCGLGRRSEHSSHKDDPWTPYNPDTEG